jgi:rubrerythrin
LSHPVKPTQVGKNRTGMATSPIDGAALLEATASALVPGGDLGELWRMRVQASRVAPPVGTMPVPATLKGVAKTVLEKLKGHEPAVYLDKLGERLAFERTGARLYEALRVKLEASHAPDPEITAEVIADIRDDELTHMALVEKAIRDLGGDPTVMTPCADVAAVASLGLLQAMTAPATTFTQALGVVLIAELADNAAWDLLMSLAGGLGQDEHVRVFGIALVEEQRHLELISRWHALAVASQSGAISELERDRAGEAPL